MTAKGKAATAGLAIILVQIGLMDLSLSIDNVIAAVGLAPKDAAGDPVMWPIYTGVFIAILALQAIAPHAVVLLKKYPILEPTAFILIGYVGVLLMVEETARVVTGSTIHVAAYVKFAGILLIIAAALLYDAGGMVRRAIHPLVRVSRPVMSGITRVVGLVWWPFEAVIDWIATFGTLV